MAIEPETFHVGESKLRWTPLPALVLAREHGDLIKRADHGTLDMLAFQLTENDQLALVSGEPQAMFVLLKSVATLLGSDNLDEVCLHYLAVGKVDVAVKVNAKPTWLPLHGDRAADNLEHLANPFDLYGAVWHVLRGVLGPLSNLLPASKGAAKGLTDGSDSSTPTEGDSPDVPT